MRHKVTVRFIESLKPRATPYEKADADVRGLLVRVQPSGIKSFIVQWKRGKRVTLDRHYPVLTIEAARTQALDILRDAKHGTPEAAKSKADAKKLTLSDYLTDHYGPWAINHHKAGAATLANLRAQFGRSFGSKPLNATDWAWNIEKFKAKRLKDGIARSTINRDIDRIRAAFNKAVELKLINSKPLATVKRFKRSEVDNERVRFLTAEEEARLRKALLAREAARRAQRISGNAWSLARGREQRLAWTKDAFTDHLAPLTLVALNTGLRRGELFGLTWDRVSLDRAQLTVTAETAKTGRTRHVPLNVEALEVLTRWKNQSSGEGLVFPGGEGARLTHINRSWASLMQAAELKDFHFHDCRHHFASRLVAAHVDLYTVSKLLGHSDIGMTQRYAHLSDEHYTKAVAKLMAKR